MSTSQDRPSIYRGITDKIRTAIEAGAGDFVMPWHRVGTKIGRPANAHTKMAYRGVNVVALWAESILAGYASGVWASYRQWEKLGAQVRKGEKGAMIVFYREIPGDDEEEDRRRVAKASWVFNASQVDGWQPEISVPSGEPDTLADVEAFIASTRAVVKHGGDTACYDRKLDLIRMPTRGLFLDTDTSSRTEGYYSTLLHELTHWTGAKHRMARAFGERFGDQAYAMEELVAELGAAFLCADLDVSNEPRPDHAAYVGHWLTVLDQDPKAIFTAARAAQQAAEFLHGLNA